MMNRTEHIAWVKKRALEYVTHGNNAEAFASYMSDMGKHPEADPKRIVRMLATSLWLAGKLRTAEQMRKFINGTN